MNKIVITNYENKKFIIFLKDDKPVKIRVLSPFNFYPDAVYVGCVRERKDNISSSFVSYGNKQFGFLKRSDIKCGTLLPVIVKKQTDGRKEDVLTDNISLCGVYIIVGPNTSDTAQVKFSSKLPDDLKKRFSKYLAENNITFDNFSVIIRSNAVNTSFESIINEYNYLANKLERIMTYANTRTEGTLLYNGLSECMSYAVSENLSDYEEILTDDTDTYAEINMFLSECKKEGIDIPVSLKQYNDKEYPLCMLISIKRLLSLATEKKVFLKSNAYITIEHTEAMTVADVNTATTSFKGSKAEVTHKVNMEAAEEIVSQLKLRNISGIIVVDFINERDENNRRELVSYIKELLKSDDSGAKFVSYTKLGLVEMTRERRTRPLKEQLRK